MLERRFARTTPIAGLVAAAALAAGCAAMTTPSACRPVCEARESEACQQCLADAKAEREEARKRREAERALGAPTNPPAGGGGAPTGY